MTGMCDCTQILRWDLGIKLRSQCLENKQGWPSPQLPEHVLLSQEHACFVHVGLPQCPCFCSFSLPSHLAVYFEGTLDPCFPCCGVHQGVWLSGCRQDKNGAVVTWVWRTRGSQEEPTIAMKEEGVLGSRGCDHGERSTPLISQRKGGER